MFDNFAFFSYWQPLLCRYKNDKAIVPGDKGRPKKISDNKYQLEISDASKDDTANYKVYNVDTVNWRVLSFEF